jgi:hypothetical protein
VRLSLKEDIRLPGGLVLFRPECVQIRIRAEVEEVEPEVLPLDLEGESDDDLTNLVVNVVDVEDLAKEVDGGRAARCGRQHLRVVVGQVVQYLPVELECKRNNIFNWCETCGTFRNKSICATMLLNVT